MKKILSILIILLTSCSIINGNTQNIWYSSFYYFEEQENGWREGFVIEIPKENTKKDTGKSILDINNEDTYIYFEGYNLKYSKINNCFVPVKDQNGNMIDKAYPRLINLAHDQTRRDEVDQISTFFQSKRFSNSISIDDLKELDLKYFTKDKLVELYNKTISQNTKEYGKYSTNINQIKQKKDSKQNIIWQVGCFSIYGNITDVQIEVIIDNEYLSDKSDLTKVENNMLSELNNIEKYIIDNQDLLLKECKMTFETVNIQCIKEILEEIYETN